MTQTYDPFEEPMASCEGPESGESEPDSDSDADYETSFPSLDNHPELFTEIVEQSWLEFHTNRTHKGCEELKFTMTWEEGGLGDNSDVFSSKITKGDQIWALPTSRVWKDCFISSNFLLMYILIKD
jgi:hypothetical protein